MRRWRMEAGSSSFPLPVVDEIRITVVVILGFALEGAVSEAVDVGAVGACRRVAPAVSLIRQCICAVGS